MWVARIAFGFAALFPIGSLNAEPPRDELSIVLKLAPLDDKQTEPPVVTAMSLSPDQKWLAVAGDDHAIRIIELQNCATVATLIGHSDWVRSVDFSNDGYHLASCGNDGELRSWDTRSEFKGTLVAKSKHALAIVKFHPDNDRLFTAGFGNDVEGWSIKAGTRVMQHLCECNDHRALDVSSDGSLIAWGGRDGKIVVLNLNSGMIEHERTLHQDRIRCLRFSQDGTRISSVAEDRRICRYDLLTQQVLFEKKLSGGKLMAMTLVDMVTTAIGSSDNLIHLHSIVDNKELGTIPGHRGTVSILCSDENRLVSSGYDTTIRIWDWKQIWEMIETSPAPPEVVRKLDEGNTVR